MTQEGGDGDKRPAYIANIHDGVTIGFKYFDCKDVRKVFIKCRAYASGRFEIRSAYEGSVLAEIQLTNSNVWKRYDAEIDFPDGKQCLYLTYRGPGNPQLGWIGFEK